VSKKSNKRGSLFSLPFLALLVLVIGLLVVFFNSSEKILFKPKAKGTPKLTISSIDQLQSYVLGIPAGSNFEIEVPAATYSLIFTNAVQAYCNVSRKCGIPISASLVGQQDIASTIGYGTAAPRIPIIIHYYFSVANAKIQANITSCVYSTRACKNVEENSIQTIMNQILDQTFNKYSQYMEPVMIKVYPDSIKAIFMSKVPLPIDPGNFNFNSCQYKITINDYYLNQPPFFSFTAPNDVIVPWPARQEVYVMRDNISNKISVGPFNWNPEYDTGWSFLKQYDNSNKPYYVAMGIVAWDNMAKQLRIACGVWEANPRPTSTLVPTATPIKSKPLPTKYLTPTPGPCPNYERNCVNITKSCPENSTLYSQGQCGAGFRCCVPQ